MVNNNKLINVQKLISSCKNGGILKYQSGNSILYRKNSSITGDVNLLHNPASQFVQQGVRRTYRLLLKRLERRKVTWLLMKADELLIIRRNWQVQAILNTLIQMDIDAIRHRLLIRNINLTRKNSLIRILRKEFRQDSLIINKLLLSLIISLLSLSQLFHSSIFLQKID